jgi:hypothetical protein
MGQKSAEIAGDDADLVPALDPAAASAGRQTLNLVERHEVESPEIVCLSADPATAKSSAC